MVAKPAHPNHHALEIQRLKKLPQPLLSNFFRGLSGKILNTRPYTH